MRSLLWMLALLAPLASAQDRNAGKSVYDTTCVGCHGSGVLGAPKPGDAAAWKARRNGDVSALLSSAIAGTTKGMPPRGGNPSLSDAQLRAAIEYMMGGGAAKTATAPTKPAAAAAAAARGSAQAAATTAAAAPAGHAGKTVYDTTCVGCHGSGVLGAPKPGDTAAWKARRNGNVSALLSSAIAGTSKGMPPRGGNPSLGDAQLRAAIEYMMGGDGADAAATAKAAPVRSAAAPVPAPVPAATAARTAAAPAPATAAAPSPAAAPPAAGTVAPPAAPAVAAAGAATPPAVALPAPSPAPSADVNAFNRLLRPPGKINRPAAESGIHDPTNEAVHQLQPPAQAFATLPKSNGGNHVDWVQALADRKIEPRWDRKDPKAAAVVMDLNIVREVKGSMPDVVYPHKQHTEWLDCSNCHPSIFVPQKGANQISMAAILLGQKCGVCHGKVAFPVSECRLCHSRKKAPGNAVAEKR